MGKSRAPINSLITVAEAARLLHRTTKTIVRWTHEGTLNVAYKGPAKNSAILLHRAEVLALAAQLAHEAAS